MLAPHGLVWLRGVGAQSYQTGPCLWGISEPQHCPWSLGSGRGYVVPHAPNTLVLGFHLREFQGLVINNATYLLGSFEEFDILGFLF